MKFEKTKVMNFQGAFRGLRNPLESWHLSDSAFGIVIIDYCDIDWNIAEKWAATDGINIEEFSQEYYDTVSEYNNWLINNGILQSDSNKLIVEYAFIGPKDMDLAKRMIKAGTSDRKFLRQIFVSVDITGPLYWWKQFDTYKIATVANSTSTMHKLANTPINLNCFETDDLKEYLELDDIFLDQGFEQIIEYCENLRQIYLKTKDKKYWKELIRWLPESWLQTRTVTLNYETLRNIYHQRKNHKLTEWKDSFCNWVKTLPYNKELIIE